MKNSIFNAVCKTRYLALLVVLIFTCGNVWGADPVATLDPVDGESYVVAFWNGTKYYALPNIGTSSSTYDGTEITVNASGYVTSNNPPLWKFEKAASGTYKGDWHLTYKKSSTTYYLYKNGTGDSNKKISAQTSSSTYWRFTKSSNKYNVVATDRGTTYHTRLTYSSSKWQVTGNSSTTYDIILLQPAPAGPTINTSSSMTTFSCNMSTGVPVKQSFSVSGTALTNNVTVTPPSGYEICLTENGTYTSSIELSKGSGTLSSTTIYVKLKDDNDAGSYSGNISCVSSGATTKNVAVSGSTPFKVTWKANGSTVTTTYVTYASGTGTALGTLPSDPDPEDYSCDGKAFYGWFDGVSYSHASTPPSIISTSTKITTDKTFIAVFADADDSSVTKTQNSFTDTSASSINSDTNLSYSTNKGGGTSNPFVTNNTIRLYQIGSGNSFGGYITISSSGGNISSITIGSAQATSVKYSTGTPSSGPTSPASAQAISASGTYTVNNLNTSSITFYCMGSSSSSRLEVNYLSITYGSTTYSNYSTTCQACVAPTSVSVTGTNKYLGGQDISLTATPDGGTGTPNFQWQKKINGVWTDLTNGNGISGATTNNLQISSCTHANSGGYRCVVSTGEGCETKSHADGTGGYGVHVYSIHGKYTSDANYADAEIIWTSGTTGTATIHLNAKKTYLFKVWSNNGYYYGHGANANEDFMFQPTTWDSGVNNREMRLFTTVEGDYTFTVNIEHGLDGSPYVNVQVGYPSMTHPNTGYVYVQKFSWTPRLHYWYNDANKLTEWNDDPSLASDQYVNICGTDYWCVPVIDYYCNFIAADHNGQTTEDQHTNSPHPGQRLYNDGSWKWGEFSTYTITYAGGDGSTGGPMAPHTGICPGSSQQLTANAFSKAYHTFNGWSDGNGHTYANLATIENIQSDIYLTAQWAPAQYSVTHTLSNATTQSGATGANAATYGTNYTATFAADQGYVLPSTISVTAGGSNITANCTWTQATGSLTIPGAYITGNIVITLTSKASYTLTFSTKSGYGSPSGGKIDATNLSFNGSGTVTNPLVEGQTLTFPSVSSFAADECSTTFEGWSTNPSCATAPTIKAGDELVLSGASGSTTYYAVYSQVEEGGGDFDPSEDVDGDFYITNSDKSYYMNHTVYNNSYFESTAAANKSAANNLFHITKISSGTDAGKFIISFVSGNSTKYVKVYNNGSNVAISVDNTTGVALSIAATSTSGAHGTYEATYGNNTRGLMFRSNDGNNSFRNYAISNAPNTGYSLLEFEPAASKTYTTNPTCAETYTVTLTGGEGASVDVNGGNVKYNGGTAARFAENDAVSILATPTTGYSFSGWTITKEHGGSVTPASSAANTTFTMPADNVTVTATFSPILVSSLKLRAQQTGQSDKTGSDLTMNCYPKEGQTGGNDPLNHTLNVAFYEVLPADALDKTYTWSVRVKASGAADWTNVDFTDNVLNTNDIINSYNKNTGNLQIKATEGTAEIKITANDGSGVSAKVTITVAKVSVTSISVDPTSMNVYAGQKKPVTITFAPLNATNKAYTTGSYTYVTIRSFGSNPFYIEGNETEVVCNETVTVTSDDGSKNATVAVTVNPLPKATFVDIVQNKTDFVGVPSTGILSSTVDQGGLTVTTTKNTPTHADVAKPATGNKCEKEHLHLVGWILKDWADENPDATSAQIATAGAGYFYTAGAEIDLVAKDGKTFYAVWAKEVTTP